MLIIFTYFFPFKNMYLLKYRAVYGNEIEQINQMPPPKIKLFFFAAYSLTHSLNNQRPNECCAWFHSSLCRLFFFPFCSCSIRCVFLHEHESTCIVHGSCVVHVRHHKTATAIRKKCEKEILMKFMRLRSWSETNYYATTSQLHMHLMEQMTLQPVNSAILALLARSLTRIAVGNVSFEFSTLAAFAHNLTVIIFDNFSDKKITLDKLLPTDWILNKSKVNDWKTQVTISPRNDHIRSDRLHCFWFVVDCSRARVTHIHFALCPSLRRIYIFRQLDLRDSFIAFHVACKDQPHRIKIINATLNMI